MHNSRLKAMVHDSTEAYMTRKHVVGGNDDNMQCIYKFDGLKEAEVGNTCVPNDDVEEHTVLRM